MPLFGALARSAEQRVRDFNAHDLANTAWAFATVGQADEQLFAALAKVAKRLGIELEPQAIANMAWAFAMV